MFEIKGKISNINYGNLLELLRPQLAQYHIPVNVGRAALALAFVPDSVKQSTLLSIVRLNRKKILDMLQRYAENNNVEITFQDIVMIGGNNMIEIKINISDVDYKSIVDLALPIVADKLRGNSDMSFLNELLNDTYVTQKVIYSVLDNIPEEMKNKMIESAVECYNDKLLEMLNSFVIEKV